MNEAGLSNTLRHGLSLSLTPRPCGPRPCQESMSQLITVANEYSCSGGRLCIKYLRVCTYCEFVSCFLSFFFVCRSDSPGRLPGCSHRALLPTWPSLVTRSVAPSGSLAKHRVSVGWNMRSHTLSGCETHAHSRHAHMHTQAQAAKSPQMSWLLLHVSQRGPSSLMTRSGARFGVQGLKCRAGALSH